uniref:Uncharacterized protein n=1 Tax=Zea mays TaxID=4577 RepID=A0A804N301_MAIZE
MMGVLLLPPLHCLFPGSDPPPLPIHHLPLALVYALACILFHRKIVLKYPVCIFGEDDWARRCLGTPRNRIPSIGAQARQQPKKRCLQEKQFPASPIQHMWISTNSLV